MHERPNRSHITYKVFDHRSQDEVETRWLSAESQLLWSARARSRAYEMCFFTNDPILSMSSFATGKMPFNLSSGLIVRPSLSFFALMYFQIAFVTSTLLNFFEPQTAASCGLKFFGLKRPMPFAFAFLLPFFEPALRLRRTCARCAAFARNDKPVFVVFVVFAVVFAVVFFDAVFFVVAVFVISVGGSR